MNSLETLLSIINYIIEEIQLESDLKLFQGVVCRGASKFCLFRVRVSFRRHLGSVFVFFG